jgi:hypothetical protein
MAPFIHWPVETEEYGKEEKLRLVLNIEYREIEAVAKLQRNLCKSTYCTVLQEF